MTQNKQWNEKRTKFVGVCLSPSVPLVPLVLCPIGAVWSVKLWSTSSSGHRGRREKNAPGRPVPGLGGHSKPRLSPARRWRDKSRGPRTRDPSAHLHLPPPRPRRVPAAAQGGRPPSYQATGRPSAKLLGGMRGGRQLGGDLGPQKWALVRAGLGSCPLRGSPGKWTGRGGRAPPPPRDPALSLPRRVPSGVPIFSTSRTPLLSPREKNTASIPMPCLCRVPGPAALRGPSAPSRGRVGRPRPESHASPPFPNQAKSHLWFCYREASWGRGRSGLCSPFSVQDPKFLWRGEGKWWQWNR